MSDPFEHVRKEADRVSDEYALWVENSRRQSEQAIRSISVKREADRQAKVAAEDLRLAERQADRDSAAAAAALSKKQLLWAKIATAVAVFAATVAVVALIVSIVALH